MSLKTILVGEYMKKTIILFVSLVCICLIILLSFHYIKSNESIVVSIDNNEILVKHTLTEDKNMIVVYNQNRNNNFFDMSQFIIQDKDKADDDFTGEIVMSTATDFISPYGLLAINNALNNHTFTVGGAHGTEGSSGNPTGSFSEIKSMSLDNKPLNKNGIYTGQNLDIEVNHYVYASNVIEHDRNRKTMLEERFYSISSMNHEVEVRLTALENLQLTRYAGLQMTQPDFYDYFYFPGLSNLYKIKGEKPGLYTLKENSYDILDRAVLFNDDSMLIMKTDRDFGIGSGDYSPPSTTDHPQSPLTYTGGKFGKIYSHNLGRSNNDFLLKEGETIKYRGGYYFRPNDNKDSKNISYKIGNTRYKDEVNIRN